jgi:hypothetical protein
MDNAAGPFGFSQISQLTDILNNALNPTCASNAISLICHAAFKECKAVEDAVTGSQLWLPSLLCRSGCEKHLETWNTCLHDLEKDPDAKRSFDAQMLALVLFCDSTLTCFLGAPTP